MVSNRKLGPALRGGFILLLAALVTRCEQMELAAASGNDICSDDFNRADAAELGKNWELSATYPQASASQVRIDNNQGHIISPAALLTEVHCKFRLEQSKTKTSVNFIAGANITNQSVLLIARSQDSVNGIICGFRNTTYDLSRALNGVTTNLVSGGAVSGAFTAGSTASVSLETDGTKLTCNINLSGTPVTMTTTDPTFSRGRVGLFFAGTVDVYFDNFKSAAYE